MPREGQSDDLEAESFEANFATRLAHGDGLVMEELVVLHQAAVYRFARSLTTNDADAEDVLQHTFVAAMRHGVSYRGLASLRSWLLRIARNEAMRINKLDNRVDADASEDLALLGQEAGWGSESPEALLQLAQERQRLDRAMASLPGGLQQILVLRDLEQIRGDEVADILGLSVAAMKSRLHRARLRLAQALRRAA